MDNVRKSRHFRLLVSHRSVRFEAGHCRIFPQGSRPGAFRRGGRPHRASCRLHLLRSGGGLRLSACPGQKIRRSGVDRALPPGGTFGGFPSGAAGLLKGPLGRVPVHEKLIGRNEARERDCCRFSDGSRLKHSLKFASFPAGCSGRFLACSAGDGGSERRNLPGFGEAIVQAGKNRRLLIVASSDLSHFHEDVAKARALDGVALRHLQDSDAEGLLENLARDRTEACGGGPMAVAILAARGLSALIRSF